VKALADPAAKTAYHQQAKPKKGLKGE